MIFFSLWLEPACDEARANATFPKHALPFANTHYAPRCAGCDVGTTKRLPLHCVSAKYFAQKGILRLTVKKGGAGRPRGIAFDFAVPFSQSGLRGLAPAPPYKPDAGEIRPWHDAVRDAKWDALAREEN